MTAGNTEVEPTGQQVAEPLDEKCQRLQQEWSEAEYARMTAAYNTVAKVDTITGALGPLYYATVFIAGSPVEALVDSGSPATIMSFPFSRSLGKQPVSRVKL